MRECHSVPQPTLYSILFSNSGLLNTKRSICFPSPTLSTNATGNISLENEFNTNVKTKIYKPEATPSPNHDTQWHESTGVRYKARVSLTTSFLFFKGRKVFMFFIIILCHCFWLSQKIVYEIIMHCNNRFSLYKLQKAFRGDRKTHLCKKCKISSPVKNTYTKCNREFKFMWRGAKATESNKVITMSQFKIHWTNMLNAFKEF